jgi:hypothetical protein
VASPKNMARYMAMSRPRIQREIAMLPMVNTLRRRFRTLFLKINERYRSIVNSLL